MDFLIPAMTFSTDSTLFKAPGTASKPTFHCSEINRSEFNFYNCLFCTQVSFRKAEFVSYAITKSGKARDGFIL